MSNQVYTYKDIFADKENILVVTAHPDDSVVFFGALMYKLRADKKNVYVLVVTNGARGSRENDISEEKLAKLRFDEEKAALKILGIPNKNVFCLGYKDGEVESNLALIGKIVEYIRRHKVDIALTHSPNPQTVQSYTGKGYFVQHRDHRKVGEAVVDAIYPFSRDRSFFPEHYVNGDKPRTIYDILLTDEQSSNFRYDFTSDLNIKKRSMRAHKSQFDSHKVDEILKFFKEDKKYLEKLNYIKLIW